MDDVESYRDKKILISSDHTWRNSSQEILFGFKRALSSSKDPPNNPNELSHFLWPDLMTQVNSSFCFLLSSSFRCVLKVPALKTSPPFQNHQPVFLWQLAAVLPEESSSLRILCLLHQKNSFWISKRAFHPMSPTFFKSFFIHPLTLQRIFNNT